MKSIYEASTTLDAHMVLNLLEQEGIQGRIDGEYLPGGVGELQALNLVRVMVNELDYERAGKVIKEWEAVQVVREESTNHKKAVGVPGFVFGLIVGGGLVFWAYNTPVTEDGVDMNGDGVLDEKWIYRNKRISRTEVDRNFDGQADCVYYFDRRGIVKRVEFDDNFDGVYETSQNYKNGLPHSRESDLNQDGSVDHRAVYKFGNLDEVVILGEGGDARSKKQKFEMGKLVYAEYDSDGDDIMDVKYEYDSFEEIKKKSSPAHHPAR